MRRTFSNANKCYISVGMKFVTQKIGMVENSGVKLQCSTTGRKTTFGSSYRKKFKTLTFILGMLYKDRSNFSPQLHRKSCTKPLGLCFGENRISSMILFLLLKYPGNLWRVQRASVQGAYSDLFILLRHNSFALYPAGFHSDSCECIRLHHVLFSFLLRISDLEPWSYSKVNTHESNCFWGFLSHLLVISLFLVCVRPKSEAPSRVWRAF